MPNGKVVTFSSMAACPADAAQLDAQGKVVRPPAVQPKPAAPARAAPSAAKPVETHVVRPPERTVYEAATYLCEGLKATGDASECKVDTGIFSASTIEVTTMSSPRLAFSNCVAIAQQLRKLAPADARATNWEIRLYSPFSGSRPTGTCKL